MENINFNWECDIMKFVINTLYLPYKLLNVGSGCTQNNIDSNESCWADELLSYYKSSFLNC